ESHTEHVAVELREPAVELGVVLVGSTAEERGQGETVRPCLQPHKSPEFGSARKSDQEGPFPRTLVLQFGLGQSSDDRLGHALTCRVRGHLVSPFSFLNDMPPTPRTGG